LYLYCAYHTKKEMHSRDTTVYRDLMSCITPACFSTFFFDLLWSSWKFLIVLVYLYNLKIIVIYTQQTSTLHTDESLYIESEAEAVLFLKQPNNLVPLLSIASKQQLVETMEQSKVHE